MRMQKYRVYKAKIARTAYRSGNFHLIQQITHERIVILPVINECGEERWM